LSLKFLSVFLVVTLAVALPAVYPVRCPYCNGTGLVQIEVVGMENIRLVNYSNILVNTVRLGCGVYAMYTSNLTLVLSNNASVPINATILYSTAYNDTGVFTSKYPLVFEVPANSSDFVVSSLQSSQVSIQNSVTLPVLTFTAQLIQASNSTTTLPCPYCDGKKTCPLIELLMPSGGKG
jgi:hypothetical protein